MIFLLMIIFIVSYSNKTEQYETINNSIFIELVNEYRLEKGLNKLTINQEITNSASIQTKYNFKNKSCNHYNKLYPTLTDRLVNSNITESICCSENIIYIGNVKFLNNIDKRIFDEYVKSISHRNNMLLYCVNYIGVYTIYDGTNIYSTVVFCD